MNQIQTSREVKNSNILFFILGVLLVPAINSLENIIFELAKSLFTLLPIKPLLIISILVHGLILISVIILLIRILQRNKTPMLNVSHKTLQIIGAVFALLILISSIISLYTKTNFSKEIDLPRIKDIDMKDFAYLSLILNGLSFARNILLIATFLVIVFKREKHEPPTTAIKHYF